ncbi:MAG: PAS domain S-box protein, partial [Deltaproteobacteria bacterium]|nr:PAS domain S-box protein [Deltaproteobacteria bacterium]
MMEKAARNYILSHWRYIIILLLFLLASYVLIYRTYENVRREMIEDLNARQMILAKQSAKGIEMFFNDHIAMLQSMAKNEHIVVLDETGKKMMREFYSSHAGEVSIITRIDSQGRIVHPEPYDPKVIHQIVTKIEDFQEVRRTRQIVVSDVFTNRRGLKTIIMHVPVFRRGSFNGTIALLFPFDFIARRYVEDIRIGQDGYAWVVSRNGTELSCPVPGHVGNSVFDNCRDFPDILAMAEKMTRGEQGATTYQFDRVRESIITKTTKQAVFMPVRLGNNFWSIVIATPEDEVTGALQGFRNRLMLIAVLFVMGMGFIIYMFFRTQILIEEVGRRRKAEEALQESEATLRSVFKAAPVGLCIMKDRVYQSANKAWYESFGYSESDVIGHTTRMLYENEEEYDRVGRELYASLSERGLASVQTRLRRKDVVFRDVILTAAPLQAEDLSSGTVVAIQDITDHRQKVEELRENQQRLSDIVEFLPDATLVLDKEGRVIAWNRAIEAMTGVEKEDMLGRGDYEYALPFYGDRRPILIDLALHPDEEMEKQYTAVQRVGDILFGEAFTPNLPPGDIHLSATAS